MEFKVLTYLWKGKKRMCVRSYSGFKWSFLSVQTYVPSEMNRNGKGQASVSKHRSSVRHLRLRRPRCLSSLNPQNTKAETLFLLENDTKTLPDRQHSDKLGSPQWHCGQRAPYTAGDAG